MTHGIDTINLFPSHVAFIMDGTEDGQKIIFPLLTVTKKVRNNQKNCP